MKASEKKMDTLKSIRVRIMKGFKLSIYCEEDIYSLHGNVHSVDLCCFIEQCKILDVRIYFSMKYLGLTPKAKFCDKVQTLSPKELLLHSLQESTFEGKNTFISNEEFSKSQKKKGL